MTTGVVYKDLLPIPDSTQPVTDPDKKEKAATIQDAPTASHAMAMGVAGDDHGEKGVAQQNHDKEVLDLGWQEPANHIANPLVGKLHNEDLWMLIRRFDKVRSP